MPFQAVRDELEKVVTASKLEMRAVSQQLVNGEITLAQWQLAMERGVKTVQVASAVAARGGWAQMTQSDWGAVGAETKRQYEYLRRFAGEIASGKQPLNGRLVVRAELYGEAGIGAFEQMRRRVMGARFERRVLGAAEHCPDCIRFAALGWQPAGFLPRIGESRCRVHCRCRFEFANELPGRDAINE
ncbi:MAG TPA: hypothetical protein PKD55_09675 [Bellilinea sp.]|nr:hypothetical protein [Bellilinea sp.]